MHCLRFLSVASDRIRMLLFELMHVSVSKEQLMALDLYFSERCRNLGRTQEPALYVALNLCFSERCRNLGRAQKPALYA